MDNFQLFLLVMVAIAIIVFIALYYVEAGYGILFNKKWGRAINNKVAWTLMEAPVFVAMLLFWWFSPRRGDLVPVIFLCLFELHYFQRSFVFPWLMKGHSKMPLGIVAMGVVFNVANAWMQGGWIFYYAPEGIYSPAWLSTPQFWIGLVLFFLGMWININSDYIIRHLRRPGDTAHYLPRGGMFNYVTSANYFGEILEWCGFAVLTWSVSGAVFALWTIANLVPRSAAIYKRYENDFGTEMGALHLKRIFPKIY